MTSRLSELSYADLESVLLNLPHYKDLSPDARRTYLKVAHELHQMADEGYLVHIKWDNKVLAIKAYRKWSGYGLKESKEFIEKGQPIGPLNQYQAEQCVKVFDENNVTTQVEVSSG